MKVQGFTISLLTAFAILNLQAEEKTKDTMITEEGKAKVKAKLERELRMGFVTLNEAAESTVEVFSNEYDQAFLKALTLEMGRELVIKLRQEAASWPKITDCDRLDAAFVDLLAKGIVGRQDFTCCQNCGHTEIGDEMAVEQKRGVAVRGYTFFHNQDTERAVQDGELFLAFGAVKDGDQETLKIANEIIATLKKHGLSTQWNGTTGKRIGLKVIWKRRGPWMNDTSVLDANTAKGLQVPPDPPGGKR